MFAESSCGGLWWSCCPPCAFIILTQRLRADSFWLHKVISWTFDEICSFQRRFKHLNIHSNRYGSLQRHSAAIMRLWGRFSMRVCLRFVSPLSLGVVRSGTGVLDCHLGDYMLHFIFALTFNLNLIRFSCAYCCLLLAMMLFLGWFPLNQPFLISVKSTIQDLNVNERRAPCTAKRTCC